MTSHGVKSLLVRLLHNDDRRECRHRHNQPALLAVSTSDKLVPGLMTGVRLLHAHSPAMQDLDLSWFLLGNDRVEATDDGRFTAHRLPADRRGLGDDIPRCKESACAITGRM